MCCSLSFDKVVSILCSSMFNSEISFSLAFKKFSSTLFESKVSLQNIKPTVIWRILSNLKEIKDTERKWKDSRVLMSWYANTVKKKVYRKWKQVALHHWITFSMMSSSQKICYGFFWRPYISMLSWHTTSILPKERLVSWGIQINTWVCFLEHMETCNDLFK